MKKVWLSVFFFFFLFVLLTPLLWNPGRLSIFLCLYIRPNALCLQDGAPRGAPAAGGGPVPGAPHPAQPGARPPRPRLLQVHQQVLLRLQPVPAAEGGGGSEERQQSPVAPNPPTEFRGDLHHIARRDVSSRVLDSKVKVRAYETCETFQQSNIATVWQSVFCPWKSWESNI